MPLPAFLAAALPVLGKTALTAGASFGLSKLLGGKGGGGGGSSLDFLDTRNPDQKRIDSTTADFITKFLPQFTPGKDFAGDFVAPLSGFEQQGLGFLQKFLDQPDQTPLLKSAQNELQQTFDTKRFDPKIGDFYRLLREEAGINQRDSIDTINRNLAGAGQFFTGERLRQTREAGTRTSNFLNQQLAQLGERERDRRLNIIPQALQVDQAVTTAPLRKTEAATKFGALPRQIEQANLEAVYQDFLRKQNELANVLAQARGGSGQPLKTIGINAPQGTGTTDFLGPILQKSLPLLIEQAPTILKTIFAGGA